MKVDTRAALVVVDVALDADSALETDSDFEAAAVEEDDADDDEVATDELFRAVLTPLAWPSAAGVRAKPAAAISMSTPIEDR